MRKDTKSSLEFLFDRLAKHPFISVGAMCVLLFFFGFCDSANFTAGSYIYGGAVLMLLFAALILLGRLGRNLTEMIVIFLVCVGFTVGGLLLIYTYQNSAALILWLSLFLLAMLTALLRLTDTLSTRNFIMIMIAAGVMFRFAYVIYTTSSVRQHDVGFFNWTWGHANYIEYWYNNGLKLPDFDVRTIWQYYHPPLHHWLMAFFLRILTLFGMEYGTATQALQFLPFLYSSMLMMVCYRIFGYVKLKGLPLVVAMAIVCFHPIFAIMGGFYNNDMLCVFLMMLSILLALRWFRKPTMMNIIFLALSVGLGMMAKLNAWMVAPAIAVLFLYVFIKSIKKKKWLGFICEYVVFGAICAPLGLWWQTRNFLGEYHVPFTYVPYLSASDAQYCGDMSWTERLFDFGHGQLTFVYDAFSDPNFSAPYNEFNPTVGLFKTALFDEGQQAISDVHFPQIGQTGPMLFWLGVILGVLCFVAFIISMISKKSGVSGIERAFYGVLALTMLGSYYVFCFRFPFTCTMNIRYCVPLIPLFAMGLGLLLKRFSGDTRGQKIFRYTTYALTACFVLMTLIVYSQVGMPEPAMPAAI